MPFIIFKIPTMKVLIDLNHPAHVHFFKNFAWIMEKEGHEILFTARDKEVTLNLLDFYKFNYVSMGKHYKSAKGKLYGMLKFNKKLISVARKFKPDLFLNIGSIYAAQSSWLMRKPSIIFDDTEHAKREQQLYKPFVNKILTPTFFRKDFGEKQIRYDGLHEMAYLDPKHFKPDPSVLDYLGVKEDEKFTILRLVAMGALHDKGHNVMEFDMRQEAVKELSKYGKVFITSEGDMPENLRPFKIKIPPEKMHDALYYASLYFGESGTMTTEAALLGTPSVRVSTIAKLLGNYTELADKYDLLYFYDSGQKGLDQAVKLISSDDAKNEWRMKKDRLFKDKLDVTEYMVNFVKDFVNGEIR